MGNQLFAQMSETVQPHVDDDCLAAPREAGPVEIHAAILEMAGDEDAGLGVVAVGERDAGEGGDSDGGGDAGNDLEEHAVFLECLDFFAAAPEGVRVAALETHDTQILLRELDQQQIQVFLRHTVIAALLAGVDAFCVGFHQSQNGLGNQMIEHQDVGLADESQGAQGEQFRVARAGTDEIDCAGNGGASGGIVGEQRVLHVSCILRHCRYRMSHNHWSGWHKRWWPVLVYWGW